MISIRCSDCGFVNWSNDELCKRCGAALTISRRALRPTIEKLYGLPWGKLLLILIVVAVLAVPFWVRQKRAAHTQDLAEAIQRSPLFTTLVTVEASGSLSDANIPNNEAITLREAGLLTVDYEPVSNPASATPYWPEPNAIAIRTMRRTYMARLRDQSKLRLTPKNTAATHDWKASEDREHQQRGWTVPLGTRELAEIITVERTDSDNAQVRFTWKWKPNEVGRHFDFQEQARLSNHRAKRLSNPRLSSDCPFKGTAELSRTGNGWEVKTINWILKCP